MENIIVMPLRTFDQYTEVMIQLRSLEIKETISNDDVELAKMLVDQFERDYIKNYKKSRFGTLFNVQRMPLEHTLNTMLKELDTEIVKQDICLKDILKQNIRLVELMVSFVCK